MGKDEKILAACTRYDDTIDAMKYCYNDINSCLKISNEGFEFFTVNPMSDLNIKNVIFNDPATIVFWADGTKTIVKCSEDDIFDPEKGLAMAICKRALGDKFRKTFSKWVPEEEKKDLKIELKISEYSLERIDELLAKCDERLKNINII